MQDRQFEEYISAFQERPPVFQECLLDFSYVPLFYRNAPAFQETSINEESRGERDFFIT